MCEILQGAAICGNPLLNSLQHLLWFGRQIPLREQNQDWIGRSTVGIRKCLYKIHKGDRCQSGPVSLRWGATTAAARAGEGTDATGRSCNATLLWEGL